MDKALVILSGGQDSTTCLYWALRRFGQGQVYSLAFDYGQRHQIELQSASTVANLAGVPHAQLPINTLSAIGGNALMDTSIPVQTTPSSVALPNTFVPGRNLLFLTLAASYGYGLGIRHLVTGVAQTDFSGYPDCRQNTITALAQALSLGMDTTWVIHTPLMHLSKRETVLLALELGALEVMAWTHTCYNGAVPPCGQCPACLLRAKGFAEADHPDPLLTRLGIPSTPRPAPE